MGHAELMKSAEERIKEYFERYNEGLISEEEAAYAIQTIADAVWDAVERLYYCVWGEGYVNKTETWHIVDFTPDLGYTPENFMKIADLKQGEAVTFNDHGLAIHTVVRIK